MQNEGRMEDTTQLLGENHVIRRLMATEMSTIRYCMEWQLRVQICVDY